MKLKSAALLGLGLVALGACSSTREARQVELPGGGPSEIEQPNTEPPGFLQRLIGGDDRPNVGPCPLLGALYDSARQVEFSQPGVERYANIAYTAEIEGVRGLCRYVDADPITMAIEVDMAFGRGPSADGRTHTYRYWVAVARRGRAPIEKQYFDIEVEFDDDDLVVRRTEEIENIVIPRATPETSGENFEILVGYELTPEQLAFNRAGKRFRVDAGSNPG